MTHYIVSVREVHVQMVEVAAGSEAEAIERVRMGRGKRLDNGLEFSHALSSDTWNAEPCDCIEGVEAC